MQSILNEISSSLGRLIYGESGLDHFFSQNRVIIMDNGPQRPVPFTGNGSIRSPISYTTTNLNDSSPINNTIRSPISYTTTNLNDSSPINNTIRSPMSYTNTNLNDSSPINNTSRSPMSYTNTNLNDSSPINNTSRSPINYYKEPVDDETSRFLFRNHGGSHKNTGFSHHFTNDGLFINSTRVSNCYPDEALIEYERSIEQYLLINDGDVCCLNLSYLNGCSDVSFNLDGSCVLPVGITCLQALWHLRYHFYILSTFFEVTKVRNKEHFFGRRDAWFFYRLMANRDLSKKNYLSFFKLYFQHLGDRSQFKTLNFNPIAVIPLSTSVVIEKVRLYNRIENTFLNRETFVPENEAKTVSEFLELNQDENLDFEHRVSSTKLELRNGFTEYEDELVSPTQSEIDAELCNAAASFYEDEDFNPRPINNYSISSMLEDPVIVFNFVEVLMKILFFF